jgi:hypothetical protein
MSHYSVFVICCSLFVFDQWGAGPADNSLRYFGGGTAGKRKTNNEQPAI